MAPFKATLRSLVALMTSQAKPQILQVSVLQESLHRRLSRRHRKEIQSVLSSSSVVVLLQPPGLISSARARCSQVLLKAPTGGGTAVSREANAVLPTATRVFTQRQPSLPLCGTLRPWQQSKTRRLDCSSLGEGWLGLCKSAGRLDHSLRQRFWIQCPFPGQ